MEQGHNSTLSSMSQQLGTTTTTTTTTTGLTTGMELLNNMHRLQEQTAQQQQRAQVLAEEKLKMLQWQKQRQRDLLLKQQNRKEAAIANGGGGGVVVPGRNGITVGAHNTLGTLQWKQQQQILLHQQQQRLRLQQLVQARAVAAAAGTSGAPSSAAAAAGSLPIQPPTRSTKVIDLRIITHSMDHIVQNPSLQYKTLCQSLPEPLAFVVKNCIVFKFEKLDPTTLSETTTTTTTTTLTEYTPEANFFLQKLNNMNTPLGQRPLILIGLRCACCYPGIMHGPYISGSTNFIDLTQPGVGTTLCTIIRSRKDHMANCPNVDNRTKGRLFAYKFTTLDKQILSRFIDSWVNYAKNQYYPYLFKSPPIDAETQTLLKELEITEDSIADELTTCFTSGYQGKDGTWTIDNLSELFLTGKETPKMEDFLDIFQVKMTHKHHQFKIGFLCRCCHQSIGDGVSFKFKDLEVLSKEIWNHVVKHCNQCENIPKSCQRRFAASAAASSQEQQKSSSKQNAEDGSDSVEEGKKEAEQEEPPVDNLIGFFKALLVHLRKILRWTIPEVTSKSDFDVYKPLPMEFMTKYEPIACQVRHFHSQVGPLPVQDLRLHDVIVGSEMHREWEGNRRFRHLILQHRPLYLQVQSSTMKQELIATTLTDMVRKKHDGGLFTLDNAGYKYPLTPNKCLEYVTRKLQKGFPDMVRSPMDRNAISKVTQISYPPQVGVMNQYVRWGFNGTSSNNTPKYKLSAFKKRGESSSSSQPSSPNDSDEKHKEKVYDFIPSLESLNVTLGIPMQAESTLAVGTTVSPPIGSTVMDVSYPENLPGVANLPTTTKRVNSATAEEPIDLCDDDDDGNTRPPTTKRPRVENDGISSSTTDKVQEASLRQGTTTATVAVATTAHASSGDNSTPVTNRSQAHTNSHQNGGSTSSTLNKSGGEQNLPTPTVQGKSDEKQDQEEMIVLDD